MPSTIIDGDDAEKLFTDLGFKVTVMRNPEVKQVIGHLGGVVSRSSQIKRERLGNGDTKGGILLGVYYTGHSFSIEGKLSCLYNQKERTNFNPHPLEQ